MPFVTDRVTTVNQLVVTIDDSLITGHTYGYSFNP